jgi:peptidoglycan/LPS O-acetylase OafA/YrhL
VNEDNALQYFIAGFFALIFASPLLAFWKGPAWARVVVTLVLLGGIAAAWRNYHLDQAEDPRVARFVISLGPAAAAASVAGLIESLRRIAAWRSRPRRRRHTHRREHTRRL